MKIIVQKLISRSPDPKQPRSCLRTSLREQASVDEPEAAWTSRKLHHRAEAASAAAAGTNPHNIRSADPTNLQPRSTRPDISQLSNIVPSVNQTHGGTNYPTSNIAPLNCLANEWPVNCQTPTDGSNWWTQLTDQEISPQSSIEMHLLTPGFANPWPLYWWWTPDVTLGEIKLPNHGRREKKNNTSVITNDS